jgi:hypothetical protein
VLIVGRFRRDRRKLLEAIRTELRQRDYLPMFLDLESPAEANLKEMLDVLIGLSRFIIADLSGARDYPAEMELMAPAALEAPVQLLVSHENSGNGPLNAFSARPPFLEPFTYANHDELLSSLSAKVIDPPEKKLKGIQEPG